HSPRHSFPTRPSSDLDHPVMLELYNPKGQLYKRLNQHITLNGVYSFHTATDADAPTGSWLAKVKVGGAVFTKNLRIETVKPNRLDRKSTRLNSSHVKI